MKDLIDITAAGGFKLTSFISNVKILLESLPREDLSPALKQLEEVKCLPSERTLGLVWHPQTDTFSFNIKVSSNCSENMDQNLSKKKILKFIASIYDPLGFLTLSCRLDLGWDDSLPRWLIEDWHKWQSQIPNLTSYEVPRNITSLRTNSYEIHVFSDGSEKAYGCVAYLRSRNAHTTSVKLLMSKSRLTPLSKSALTTTPRIELCAAKLGVELIQQLRRELTLDIQNETFWSDSVTVLRYINNENKRFHRYLV